MPSIVSGLEPLGRFSIHLRGLSSACFQVQIDYIGYDPIRGALWGSRLTLIYACAARLWIYPLLFILSIQRITDRLGLARSLCAGEGLNNEDRG